VEAVEAKAHHQREYQERPIVDLAVHGDQVVVLTSSSHPEGSALRLLDLDGRYLRTIAAGRFRSPHAVAAAHGRAFVVDQYEEEGYVGEPCDDDDPYGEDCSDKVLHVIDTQSGDLLQSVTLELTLCAPGAFLIDPCTILVDGDEIYIADYEASTVVLRFAGSCEAGGPSRPLLA